MYSFVIDGMSLHKKILWPAFRRPEGAGPLPYDKDFHFFGVVAEGGVFLRGHRPRKQEPNNIKKHTTSDTLENLKSIQKL